MDYKKTSDQYLWERCQKQDDIKAYAELFDKYVIPLRRQVVRYIKSEFDAEEIVMDLLFNLWAKRNKLIPDGDNLKSISTEHSITGSSTISTINKIVEHNTPKGPIRRAMSEVSFSVFEDYDPNNLLLREAYDEVFDFQLEEGRMQEAFERIADHRIVLARPVKLTPFFVSYILRIIPRAV